MANAKKVSWAQLRVGIMAIVAVAILFVLVFLLTGNKSLFSKEYTVYTYLDDSAAITEGSAVRLNGILIGKIGKVGLSGENIAKRIIRLDLVIEASKLKQIPEDSAALIGAENLLGTKYINIKMGKALKPIAPGGELKSADSKEFQDLVNAAYPSLEAMQDILTRVTSIVKSVEDGEGSVGKLLKDDEIYNRLNKTLAEIQKVTEYIASGKGTVGKLLYDDGMYDDLRGVIKKVDGTVTDLRTDLNGGKGSVSKLLKDPALHDELKATISELRKTVEEINKGNGTAGKLVKSDELHTNLNKLINDLDQTLAKVNAGQGTIGQLMVNPSLYESMNGTMKEVNGLMKDFRSNPKKFLTIQLKLF